MFTKFTKLLNLKSTRTFHEVSEREHPKQIMFQNPWRGPFFSGNKKNSHPVPGGFIRFRV